MRRKGYISALAASLALAACAPARPAERLIDGPAPPALEATATTPAPPMSLDDVPPTQPVLHMTPEGIHVWFGGIYVPPGEGCAPTAPTVCAQSDGTLDRRRLYNVLVQLKELAPDEDVFHIAPQSSTPFEQVIEVMDVARWRRTGAGADGEFADDASFASSAPDEGAELFAQSVLMVAP